MNCKNCGKAVDASWNLCPGCGAKTERTLVTAPGAPRPLESATSLDKTAGETNQYAPITKPAILKHRSTWITVCSIILTLVALNSFGVFSGLTGQVNLDVPRVEQMIEDGIYDQSGFSVVATCPSPMAGKVGDTRSCAIEDENGDTYVVDVTIQNKNGDVIWVVRT